MKKLIVLFFTLAVIIAGCSAQKKDTPTEPAAPTDTATITSTPTITGTPTTTPTPVCTKTLGDWADFSDGAWGSGEIIAVPVIPSKSGYIDKLGVKLYGAVSFRMAVYSDNSGEPGTVLLESAVTSGSTGWNEITISQLALTQGVKYWLACACSGFGVCDDEAYNNEAWRYSVPWANITSTGFPSNLPGWNTGTGRAKIYAAGCF